MVAKSIEIVVTTLILSNIQCDTTSTEVRHKSRQPRIEGGSLVHVEAHRYLVSVRKNGKHICGGSIYSGNIILTSAHCIRDNSTSGLTVKVGSSSLQTGGSIYEVVYAHRHEDYQYNDEVCNDVALLKLKSYIEFHKKTIQAVELFERDERLNDSVTATALGWGRTQPESLFSWDYLWFLVRYPFYGKDKSVLLSEDLRGVELRVMSPRECRKISNWCVKDFICTYTPGNVTCKGDSGGPLMVFGRQAGIATASGGCGVSQKKKNNAVFTSVALYRDWIDENAKILSLL